MKKPGFVGVLLWFLSACSSDIGQNSSEVAPPVASVMCTQTLPAMQLPPFTWEFPNCRGVFHELISSGLLSPTGTAAAGDYPDHGLALAFRFGQGDTAQMPLQHRVIYPDGQREGVRLFTLEQVGSRAVLKKIQNSEISASEISYEQGRGGPRISQVRYSGQNEKREKVEGVEQFTYENDRHTGKTTSVNGQTVSAWNIQYGKQFGQEVPQTVLFSDRSNLQAEYREVNKEVVLAGFTVRDENQRVLQTVTYDYEVMGGRVQLVGSKNGMEVQTGNGPQGNSQSQRERTRPAQGENATRREWLEDAITIAYRPVESMFLPAVVTEGTGEEATTTTFEFGREGTELVLTGRVRENNGSTDVMKVNYADDGGLLKVTQLVHNMPVQQAQGAPQQKPPTIRFE